MALTRKAILDKLKIHYKLLILNDDTFEEKFSFKLNGINALLLGSSLGVLMVALVTILIIFTPLKEYIPGYADVKLRRDMTRLISVTDSLADVQAARDNYILNLKQVLSGRAGIEALSQKDKPVLIESISLNDDRPEEDKELRAMIEEEEKQNPSGVRGGDAVLSGYEFVRPLKGVVTEKYKPSIGHFATDIACKKGEKIKAVLEGVLVFSAFTKETGYVAIVQHDSGIASIYKHCSAITKKVNSFVQAGDIIALAGDTGELTTGPHLHFELWHNGKSVNPQDYINF